MADDLSWIDHPANLRANAVLLRAVADQSLLHADEIERLTAAPDGYLNKDDLIADLRNENDNLHEMNAKLHSEIERLRAALTRLTTDITSSAAAMDAVSLSIFEDALAALGEKP
jgi:septal ring factor EnvC (AmiA/AmiB activator)